MSIDGCGVGGFIVTGTGTVGGGGAVKSNGRATSVKCCEGTCEIERMFNVSISSSLGRRGKDSSLLLLLLATSAMGSSTR